MTDPFVASLALVLSPLELGRLFIVHVLPWILSCITIWMTLLAGNHRPNAWAVGLANQGLWLVWMLVTGVWGLLPLNAALWVVYARNHMKWRREQLA